MFSKSLVHKGKLKEIFKVGKGLHKKIKSKKVTPKKSSLHEKKKGKGFSKFLLGAGALAGAGLTYREYKHYKESGEASPEGKHLMEFLEGAKEDLSRHFNKAH